MPIAGSEIVKVLPGRKRGTTLAFALSPGMKLIISDKEDNAKVEEKIKKIKELQFPWVGVNLRANLLALHFASGDKNKFLTLVKKVYDSTDVGIVLISEDLDVLFAARDI